MKYNKVIIGSGIHSVDSLKSFTPYFTQVKSQFLLTITHVQMDTHSHIHTYTFIFMYYLASWEKTKRKRKGMI